MLYSSRRARHNALMSAVLPDPTGLQIFISTSSTKFNVEMDITMIIIWGSVRDDIPSNANGKGTVFPVTALDQRHLTVGV